VALDTRGSIDLDAERSRLTKDLAAAVKEQDAARAKLGNAEFLAKAPEPVVEKIRGRLAAAEAELARIAAALESLG
jgi:valyl-tRNA synthetase